MLQTALLFRDHMVLQRGKKIVIWGRADAGERITISLQGQTASAYSDQDGSWQLTCGPFKESFAEECVVSCGTAEQVFRDVQIGEVWLAGGQSNMEFHMRYDADMAAERETCSNPDIRFFDYPEVSYAGQIAEADYGKNYGFWRKAEPEQLERFSAVGYYFAKDLYEKYKVPIGIIGCNWGGVPACAWMSHDAIVEGGGQIWLDEYRAAVEHLDLSAYEEKFRNDPMSWRLDILANPIENMMMSGCSFEEIQSKLTEMGMDPPELDPSVFLPVMGPKCEKRPSGLYESMLRQVAPYTIRGVIWYQGESDSDGPPEVYKTLFPALIRDWRRLWKDEFPFLFVQVAPLEKWMDCVGERFVGIRAAQQHAADTVTGSGMAVITDAGMQFDIHPKKKQPVGHRLALLAENKVYGEDVLCEAPALIRAETEEGRVILTFDYAGDGLYLSENVPYGQKIGSDRLGGLQVFQEGRALPEESLKAQAGGCQVIVSSERIHADISTEVKLAETGWYLVNLYNSAGIPARPAEISSEKFRK